MLKFALKNMATRWVKLVMTALSVVIACSVALLAYNISTQVSEGIVNTAANYDLIIGPAGSSTQLAMNTMFFTDKPLGTIPWSVIDELEQSGLVNAAIPFSMGDSYNDAPIVGTEPALLDGKQLSDGTMFAQACEAVVGWEVARQFGLGVGDSIITSHGLSSAGAEHADSPLTVTGILDRTYTAYDNAIFTGCETIWALHDHEEAGEEEEEGHAEAGEICAVLVRSRSLSAYSTLVSAYSDSAEYLAINPNTVLREVLENVDLSRKIVYILCAVILAMNLFVISVIALLNMYDSRTEISLMRLIGISMRRINLLYLIQNAIVGLAAMLLSLLSAHLGLLAIRSFVASMGIVLNAWHVYPLEWAILLAVFVISILPTMGMNLHIARQDGLKK